LDEKQLQIGFDEDKMQRFLEKPSKKVADLEQQENAHRLGSLKSKGSGIPGSFYLRIVHERNILRISFFFCSFWKFLIDFERKWCII
jgi:hypothetical protein